MYTLVDFIKKHKDALVVSMDSGNGNIKFYVKSKGKEIIDSVPSIISSVDYTDSSMGSREIIEYNGTKYIIGSTENIIPNTEYTFHIETGPVFLYYFMKKHHLLDFLKSKKVILLLGTSLTDRIKRNFYNLVVSFRNFKIVSHMGIKETYNFGTSAVLITMQGMGALKRYLVQKYINPETKQLDISDLNKVMSIDIGHKTVIPITFENINNELVVTASSFGRFHRNQGAISILNSIQSGLRELRNQNIDLQGQDKIENVHKLWIRSINARIKDYKLNSNEYYFVKRIEKNGKPQIVLNNGYFNYHYNKGETLTNYDMYPKFKDTNFATFFKISGNVLDIRHIIVKAELDYLLKLLPKEIYTKYQVDMAESDFILFSGGLVHLMKMYKYDDLMKYTKGISNFVFIHEYKEDFPAYEFANVMGYYNNSFSDMYNFFPELVEAQYKGQSLESLRSLVED